MSPEPHQDSGPICSPSPGALGPGPAGAVESGALRLLCRRTLVSLPTLQPGGGRPAGPGRRPAGHTRAPGTWPSSPAWPWLSSSGHARPSAAVGMAPGMAEPQPPGPCGVCVAGGREAVGVLRRGRPSRAGTHRCCVFLGPGRPRSGFVHKAPAASQAPGQQHDRFRTSEQTTWVRASHSLWHLFLLPAPAAQT